LIRQPANRHHRIKKPASRTRIKLLALERITWFNVEIIDMSRTGTVKRSAPARSAKRTPMLPCIIATRLEAEKQRLFDKVIDLFRRKQLAFAHGNENTVSVLDREIRHTFVEKDRTETALQAHYQEHRCG
jgi:hypothetical protein